MDSRLTQSTSDRYMALSDKCFTTSDVRGVIVVAGVVAVTPRNAMSSKPNTWVFQILDAQLVTNIARPALNSSSMSDTCNKHSLGYVVTVAHGSTLHGAYPTSDSWTIARPLGPTRQNQTYPRAFANAQCRSRAEQKLV